MARFRLLPAKLNNSHVAVLPGEELSLDWEGLRARFGTTERARRMLTSLKTGWFVGRRRGPSGPVTFAFYPLSRGTDASFLGRQVPELEGQVLELWRCEEVEWDGRVTELPSILNPSAPDIDPMRVR